MRNGRFKDQPERGWPLNAMKLSAALAFVSFSEERMHSFQQLLRGLEQRTLLRTPGLQMGEGLRLSGSQHWNPGSFPSQVRVFPQSILSEVNPSHHMLPSGDQSPVISGTVHHRHSEALREPRGSQVRVADAHSMPVIIVPSA